MINQDYLYTDQWNDVSKVSLLADSLYLYATDKESRSNYCAPQLKANNKRTSFIQVSLQKDDMLMIVGTGEMVSLNSMDSVRGFLSTQGISNVYIDVTGMSCRIVAPLLLVGIEMGLNLFVVYTEPSSYKIAEFQKVGINKDLSEDVDGVYPLPGLGKVIPHRIEPLFVTLLGFEGGRLSFLLSDQTPSYEKIRPIFGVPGYRVNYPYVSYLGNRRSLQDTRCWKYAEYAEANSIVDAYLTLVKIFKEYKRDDMEMIVAPIGTKPHAIGAILFAIKYKEKVELLYDNPHRNVHRTDGIGKVLSCNVSRLIADY